MMSYPASAFTQQGQPPQSFLTHRVIQQQHHQQQQPPQQQQQPTHVAPSTIHAQQQQQQQQQQQPQPTPPNGLAVPPLPPQQQQQQHSPPIPGSSGQQSLPVAQDPLKVPYGAGSDDDGYTLVFANIDEFQAWRAKEEMEQCVDFVKGDVHGSRAVPPRFKEHTKLVCARHVRSGRKKYVKKHPERQRKLPSRKLDGIGCPASISYKTYFDSEQVRACYNANHSHPTGAENYPFTRRGRKEMANQRSNMPRLKKGKDNNEKDGDDDDGEDQEMGGDEEEVEHHLTSQPPPPPPQHPQPPAQSQFVPPPTYHHPYGPPQSQPPPPPPEQQPPPLQQQQPSASTLPPHRPARYKQPAQSAPKPPPQPVQQQQQPPPPPPPQMIPGDPEKTWRWDRLTAMFESIKANARTFDYPQGSLAALEATLVRLTLESPLGSGG